MDPKLTGNIIAEKRKALGLNQIQLAERLNVSNRTISKWENGDGYPDITMLCDIADCLDITIDELLTGKTPTSRIIETEKPCAINKDKQKYIFSVLFSISICLSVFSAFLLPEYMSCRHHKMQFPSAKGRPDSLLLAFQLCP